MTRRYQKPLFLMNYSYKKCNFRKEERMDKKVVETINALCDWVKNELESIDGNDKESIMPEMIEALTELIRTYQGY